LSRRGAHLSTPRLTNLRERLGNASALRQRTAEGALGHVLDLDGDTAANLFLYPRGITSLTTLVTRHEVTPAMRWAARAAAFPVDRRAGPLDAMPLKDDAYDTVVSTFALASSRAPAQALAEIRRVLKPGGRLLFLEYGLSTDPEVARWQQRLGPVHRLFNGVALPLLMLEAEIAQAGFELRHLENHFLARVPRALGCVYEGIAFSGV
jgi:SAM-dependent methyltransferase